MAAGLNAGPTPEMLDRARELLARGFSQIRVAYMLGRSANCVSVWRSKGWLR